MRIVPTMNPATSPSPRTEAVEKVSGALPEAPKDPEKKEKTGGVAEAAASSPSPQKEGYASSALRLARSTQELMESRKEALDALRNAGERIAQAAAGLREVHARVVEKVTPSASMAGYRPGISPTGSAVSLLA